MKIRDISKYDWDFYITGLPRSGTMWMANLLTTSDTLCLHEPACYSKLKKSFNDMQFKYINIGMSCPSLPMFKARVDKPTVIINRDEAECYDSCREVVGDGLTSEFWRSHLDMLRIFKESNDHLEIDFSQLDDIGVIEDMWEYLNIQEEFPEYKFREATRMRITMMDSPIDNIYIER